MPSSITPPSSPGQCSADLQPTSSNAKCCCSLNPRNPGAGTGMESSSVPATNTTPLFKRNSRRLDRMRFCESGFLSIQPMKTSKPLWKRRYNALPSMTGDSASCPAAKSRNSRAVEPRGLITVRSSNSICPYAVAGPLAPQSSLPATPLPRPSTSATSPHPPDLAPVQCSPVPQERSPSQ